MEGVVAEKRQEDDTLSEKSLEVETEEWFSRNIGRPIRTVKRPMWMRSGDYVLSLARTAITCGGEITIGSYELRAREGLSDDLEGKSGCIGGK